MVGFAQAYFSNTWNVSKSFGKEIGSGISDGGVSERRVSVGSCVLADPVFACLTGGEVKEAVSSA